MGNGQSGQGGRNDGRAEANRAEARRTVPIIARAKRLLLQEGSQAINHILLDFFRRDEPVQRVFRVHLGVE